MKEQPAKYYLVALVSLFAFVVYLPALGNGFVYDDHFYVVDNEFLRTFDRSFLVWIITNSYEGNWHPLTWMSHAADYAVWGLNPLGHHLTNLLFHAVNTALVMLLVISLVRTGGKGFHRKSGEAVSDRGILTAAGVAGMLFGIHPLHVESVAWVAERKDLLCAMFFLLSMTQYVRYAGYRVSEAYPGKFFSRFTNKYYLSTFLFFFLALLSKPMAVTLPLVLLLLDWHPFGRIHSLGDFLSALYEKIPFIAMSFGSSIITLIAQSHGGAMPAADFAPAGVRAFVIMKSYVVYLMKMLVPLNLLPLYPYPQNISWVEYVLPFLILAGLTGTCLYLSAVRRQKLWLAIWIYYLMTLIPVIGIVQVGEQSMADRYTYIPSIGLFLLIGMGAGWVAERAAVAANKPRRIIGILAAVIAMLTIVLSFLTIRQIRIWKSDIDLWTYTIEQGSVRHYIPYYNRATFYLSSGRPDKAVSDFNNAAALKPSWYAIYNNRGLAYDRLNLIDKALSDYDVAVVLNQNDPSPYRNRGFVNMKLNQAGRAMADFERGCLLGDGFSCAMSQTLRTAVH